MKYYFTNECYWDSEEKKIFRNNEEVDLTPSQTNILTELLKHNGSYVSHEALYFAMTGTANCVGNWKAQLSNQFSRNKSNEKGILIRVPEIEELFKRSRSQVGGGYMISVPEENIIKEKQGICSSFDNYRDIWLINSFFENQKKNSRTSDTEWLSKKAKLYLQGESCSWPLIFASDKFTPVKRDILEELKTAIEDEIGVIVLTGAGGEGKSTILMQLCRELFNSGRNVFFHDSTPKYDFPDNLNDCIFLVDNPPNTFEFKKFLNKAVKEGLTVVIASRSNEWATLKETLFEDTKRNIKEIEIQKISHDEATSFATYITTHIHWVEKSTKELERMFFQDSYGFLYASMLMAIYNQNSLERIAEGIIERISEFDDGELTLKILAAIVFSERAGVNIGTRIFKELCNCLKVDNKSMKYYLRKEVVLNGTVYQTRHETISKLFYKYLFEDGDWQNYLDEDEREDVIITILNIYLDRISKSDKDFSSTDCNATNISNLVFQAFNTIVSEETQEFILQRFLESCQLHGCEVISRVYFMVTNDKIKISIAEKCFDHKLPVWKIYSHWIETLFAYDKSSIELFKTICVDMHASASIWLKWAKYQIELKNIGDINTEYTARWIFKEGCDLYPSVSIIWLHWAQLESSLENYGDVNTAYTARWIFKEGCSLNPDIYNLWFYWATLEAKLKNYGSFDTLHTARWIFKEGCTLNPDDYNLWLHWAKLESELENYGDIDTPYTARWIFKEGCTLNPDDYNLWLYWAKLESELENYGDIDTQYTARWIFKEGCSLSQYDCVLLLHWAKLEAELGNYGNINVQYTARWIFKKGCISNPNNDDLWLHWAKLENELGNYGNVNTEYTMRWICKEGCILNPNKNDLWLYWARFESDSKNYGDVDTEYTARWIFKEGCFLSFYYSNWLYWAEMESALGNYGDVNTVYTARWIFKEGCSLYSDHSIWLHWAELEKKLGNYGDYTLEYSCAWIYQKCCFTNCKAEDALCWYSWMKFALDNPMYDSERNYITYDYVFNYAKENFPSVINSLIKLIEYNKSL